MSCVSVFSDVVPFLLSCVFRFFELDQRNNFEKKQNFATSQVSHIPKINSTNVLEKGLGEAAICFFQFVHCFFYLFTPFHVLQREKRLGLRKVV